MKRFAPILAVVLLCACATTEEQFNRQADVTGSISEDLGHLYATTAVLWDEQTPAEVQDFAIQVTLAAISIASGGSIEAVTVFPQIQDWFDELNARYPWTVSFEDWIGVFDSETAVGRGYIVEALTSFTRGIEEGLKEVSVDG